VSIHEMVCQLCVVLFGGESGGTRVDSARYGGGGEKEERQAHVNGEEVLKVGIMSDVSSKDGIAPVEAAKDGRR
jgi:hypothetical protein